MTGVLHVCPFCHQHIVHDHEKVYVVTAPNNGRYYHRTCFYEMLDKWDYLRNSSMGPVDAFRFD